MQRIETAAIFEPWGNSTVAENYDRYLDPVDDLPPTTVITHWEPRDGGQLFVRGTTIDNGRIKFVTVNGQEATSLRDGFAEWQILLTPTSASGIVELLAQATDAAGNIEPRPHRVVLEPPPTEASLAPGTTTN